MTNNTTKTAANTARKSAAELQKDAAHTDAGAQAQAENAQAKQTAQNESDNVQTGGAEIVSSALEQHADTGPKNGVQITYSDMKQANSARDTAPRPLKGQALEIARRLAQGDRLTACLGNTVVNKLHAYGYVTTDTEGKETQVYGYRFSVREKTHTAEQNEGKAKYATQHIQVSFVPVPNGFKIVAEPISSIDLKTSLDLMDLDALRAQLARAEANNAANGKKLSARLRGVKNLLAALDAPTVSA